jgi:methionine sulfoxide reductase heme-binding subunit
MQHDPTFWLLARASGMTAYLLLVGSALAGITVKSRPVPRFRPAQTTELHKTLSLAALTALAAHGGALLLDSTVKIAPPELIVPGLSPYRPLAVAAGVVAAWLLMAVVASFWLRHRIGGRAWRRLHWATYILLVLATVHGLAAGTDSTQPWGRDIYLLAVAMLGFATCWRALAKVRAAA